MFNFSLCSSSSFPYSHHSCTKTQLTESTSTLSTRLWSLQTESKGLMWVLRCGNVCVCIFLCLYVCMYVCRKSCFVLSPGYGLSSVWRSSEPEEPSAHLLFVGGLRHGPKRHPRASQLHLFRPMGEIQLTVRSHLTNNKRWSATEHLSTLLHQIADGQRELIRSHSVKNRHFIGNTSMDAGLSFIMANHAKVNENDLVFDPFVGTGEIIPSPTLTHTHS